MRDDVGHRAQRDHDAAHGELLEFAGVRYDPDLVRVFAGLDRGAWRAVADVELAPLAA